MFPRRTHRKRTSALRLSSDTTATLPEYISVGSWHREDALHYDKPPDYPDSAEEADEDTDGGSNPPSIYVSPPPPLPHPRSPPKTRKFVAHRRKKSPVSFSDPNDPFLDSLLARSVHALEMSNTLLQSSMATQSSLSNIFAADSPVDHTLETRARGLSMRMQKAEGTRSTWADELVEISRGVDGLFEDEGGRSRSRGRAGPSSFPESSISRSLPVTSPLSRTSAERRKHDSRNEAAPMASTTSLGLFTGSSTHLPLEGSQLDFHGLPSSPRLTDHPLEPSTPAYNMLASFVNKTSSSNPSRSFLPRRRHSHDSPPSQRSQISPSKSRKPQERSAVTTPSSFTPKQILTSLPHRPMTPPSEESSGLSDGCPAKLTVQSLRKILDDQPAPLPPERLLRPPAFLPRTPVTIAEAGTSTTTASVSRLFTKSKHSSSTRPPSPPPRSALKQPSPAISPSASTSTIPDLPGVGVGAIRAWSGGGSSSGGSGNVSSTSASGRSTPRRISFAELPESYARSKSAESSSMFRDMQQKKRNKNRHKGKRKGEESEGDGGWWSGWFVGASAALRQEEKMDDRMSRHWGGRIPGSAFHDWPL